MVNFGWVEWGFWAGRVSGRRSRDAMAQQDWGAPLERRGSSQISKAVLSAPDGWADAWQDARIEAAKETGGEIQRFPAACPWTVEQVLGEGWLPE